MSRVLSRASAGPQRWLPTRSLRAASPARFYTLAGRLLPWCWAAAALFGGAGLVVGLLLAPADLQQGEADRIVFVHVPAAWMSMLIYLAMAGGAAIGLVLDARLPSMMATALAPTGALMSFIALWTGSLWGKPSWGSWWVWDARLTSELLLLLLYLGFIALQATIDDARRADRAGAVLAIVGVVNLPLIYYSLTWWNTLHAGPGISVMDAPSLAGLTFAGLLLMLLAFWAWAIAVALHRVRSILLERERDSDWVAQLSEAP